MDELEQICLSYRTLVSRAEPAFLATVVRGEGAAYRAPGERMLFSNGRVVAGAISGANLAAEVVRRGPWLCADHAHVGRYEGDVEDEPHVGRGCDGSIEVLVERVGPLTPGPLPLVEGCLREEQRVAIATVIAAPDTRRRLIGARVELGPDASPPSTRLSDELAGQLRAAAGKALSSGNSSVERIGDLDVFIEAIEPPPHLFVFGGGPDALPLVTVANAIGWRITVWDANGQNSVRERFARVAGVLEGSAAQAVERLNRAGRPLAVVLSNHDEADTKALAALLDSRAVYVGVLGSTRRPSRLLHAAGGTDRTEALPRVHGPAGLASDTRSPAEIALAITAEAKAALTGAAARASSCRREALHVTLATVVDAR